MIQAREAQKLIQNSNGQKKVLEHEPRQFSGLSFKTQDIPVERIPMPKNWEMVKTEIDGKEETYFTNNETGQNTRQDPRVPIKTHLEEQHCQLTTEMISRINNPSAFNPVSQNFENFCTEFSPNCNFFFTEFDVFSVFF